jgi:transposase
VPALQPYLIEPIWEQLRALLPERETNHPLGCHRLRISDRMVFEKLVQVLVFGCAYERIADESCSATTLRRRRDEWIEAGAMEVLREMALGAYDKLIGLQLCDVAIDSCITKAPCGGEKAGRSPVDRGKQGIKRSAIVDAKGIPLGAIAAPANRHDSPLLEETLDTLEVLGELPEQMSVHLDRGYDSRTTREKLKDRGLLPAISEKGKQAGSAGGHKALGSGAHKLLEQRPQEARMVYRTARSGHRFLDCLLGGGHHRAQAHKRGLDPLSLGGPTLSSAMIYLLAEAVSHGFAFSRSTP